LYRSQGSSAYGSGATGPVVRQEKEKAGLRKPSVEKGLRGRETRARENFGKTRKRKRSYTSGISKPEISWSDDLGKEISGKYSKGAGTEGTGQRTLQRRKT